MVDFKLSRGALLGEEDKSRSLLADLLIILLLVFMIANITIQSVWLSPVKVSGDSMNVTLDDGDWLLMSKIKEPKRGDVIVFAINDEINYIKRVIALEGDELYADALGIHLKKKGSTEWEIIDDEHAYYSKNANGGYSPTYTTIPLTVVGKDQMFVLGDNRNDSRDSRDKSVGLVEADQVLGVVPEWSIKHRDKYTGYLQFVEKVSDWLRNLFNK